MPELNPSNAGIALVLYIIVKELFVLVRILITKKEDVNKEPSMKCEAESKEITKLRMEQMNEQSEKIIEVMGKMTTTLALMNETVHSTNGKAARTETAVNFIKQQMS